MNPTVLADAPLLLRSARMTAPFGDLLVAVFDEAARYSTDFDVVSRMATEVVARILRRSASRGDA